jgi:hypothetical protein
MQHDGFGQRRHALDCRDVVDQAKNCFDVLGGQL